MVPGEDLPGLARRLVEDDEVLHEVHEVALVADTLEQCLHVHRTQFLLGQALPLVEMFPLAGDGAYLGLLAVAKHHDSVVVEEVRDGVPVVRVVLLEGGLQVLVDVLALHEEQRQAVHEADDVCPPAVEVAAHPQLAYAEEVVVFRILEIEYAQPCPHPSPLVVAERDLHAIAYQRVLLTVGRDDGLGGGRGVDLAHCVVVGGIGQVRVQCRQLLAQRACQYHVTVRGPAQEAVRSEVFVVVGVYGFPAELILQVLGCGLLYEGVLGVV